MIFIRFFFARNTKRHQLWTRCFPGGGSCKKPFSFVSTVRNMQRSAVEVVESIENLCIVNAIQKFKT